MAENATVLTKRSDQTLVVELNRPEKRNALNAEMIHALREVATKAAESSEISLIILKSHEGPFCAGADLEYMKAFAKMTLAQNQAEAEALFDMFAAWSRLPLPVLCLAQGAAMGGALGLFACSDFVVVAEDIKMAFSEVRLGLLPATIAPFVLKKTQHGWAQAVMLSGESFSAQSAQENGLVFEVCKSHELEYRENYWQDVLKRNSASAMRRLKNLILQMESPVNTLRSHTAKAIAEARVEEDAQKRLDHFFQGRS